jgi:hypothetical protein
VFCEKYRALMHKLYPLKWVKEEIEKEIKA